MAKNPNKIDFWMAELGFGLNGRQNDLKTI